MRSLPIVLPCLLALLSACAVWAQFATPPPDAEPLSDEEKKRQFLRAREEMKTLPPATPAATPVVRPKPRPRSTPPPPTPEKPRPTPTMTPPPATPKPATPRPTTPKPEPPAPAVTPRPRQMTPPPTPAVTPRPATATPRTAPPTPQTTPAPPPPAPVTIEKSGLESEQGMAESPKFGWFTRWKYLSKSVRRAIDQAPVQKRRWKYIVIHNSGTRQGNAKAFEYYHLRVRKMPNGLAYHFVVGNGSSSGDGEVEIGNRWRRQINGGHVHSDFLNNIALGICLVGDFNRDEPTKKQLAATEELVRYLRGRVGKIDRKWATVKAHREINPPRWPTDCPGDRFPYRWLHSKFD